MCISDLCTYVRSIGNNPTAIHWPLSAIADKFAWKMCVAYSKLNSVFFRCGTCNIITNIHRFQLKLFGIKQLDSDATPPKNTWETSFASHFHAYVYDTYMLQVMCEIR